MSPRNKAMSEDIREQRRVQILDAALTVYIEKGYNGGDMDDVAAEAGLAKGLVYYYFKSKKELFRATFEWAFTTLMQANQDIAAVPAGTDPVERLVRYIRRTFTMAEKDRRILRFSMRLPFDAYAVFGPTEWKEGFKQAQIHRDTLASMIADIASAGLIPPLNVDLAANSFWAVFIANTFAVTAMVGASRAPAAAEDGKATAQKARDVITFCFQGLGLPYAVWGKYLEKMERET